MHALEDWMEKGYQAFGVMEKHLATNDFFAAGHYTIADIALYGYTHVAHECDFELDDFPGDPRLAQPHRRPARPRADGLASGSASGGVVTRPALIPMSRITLAHCGVSAAITAANSAGVLPMTSMPRAVEPLAHVRQREDAHALPMQPSR